MAVSCQINDPNNEIVLYTFRFGSTDKVLELSEEELNCIPYLSVLVSHNNDFSSIQNADGEYVLSSRIRYHWFLPIFHAATTEHPSVLFTELPREAYLWGMLQLYDYLCVNPIPVPLLKRQNLVRTKSDNIDEKKFYVEYSPVKSLLEVRDTAAQFIIALSNNEYNLKDSNTLNSVFSLIISMVSNSIIFDVGLCYHMLTVTKDLYFQLFSSKQQHQLKMAEKSIERIRVRSLVRLCDDEKLLLGDFNSAFAWKGKCVFIQENITDDGGDRHFNPNKIPRDYTSFFIPTDWLYKNFYKDLYYPDFEFVSSWSISYRPYINKWKIRLFYEGRRENPLCDEEQDLWLKLHSTMSESSLYNLLPVLRNRASLITKNPDNKELYIYQIKQEQKKIEAKSARSGYLNTLPKRTKVDKFKHRCGTKTPKHR